MGRQAEGPWPPWASLGRQSSWQAALLAAVLSSCFLLSQAQEIPITVVPLQTLEGQDVTLTPGGNPNFVVCVWYRGEEAEANRMFTYTPSSSPEHQNGPGFTGRETRGVNCSLHIKSLALNDTGDYIVSKITTSGVSEKGRADIKVLEKLSKPYLWPREFIVKEHTNVTLNCNISESSSVYVFWFKDGKHVPAKAILSESNRTLTIPDINRDDEGMYTCQAWNPANNATSDSSKIALDSPPPQDEGLTAGQIVGIVIGCLLGVTLIVVVVYFVVKCTSLGSMEQHSSNGNIPSAPGHNQGVTDTKPTAGEEDIQYTTLAFNSNSPPQSSQGPTVPLESGTVYSVIKKK